MKWGVTQIEPSVQTESAFKPNPRSNQIPRSNQSLSIFVNHELSVQFLEGSRRQTLEQIKDDLAWPAQFDSLWCRHKRSIHQNRMIHHGLQQLLVRDALFHESHFLRRALCLSQSLTSGDIGSGKQGKKLGPSNS